MLNVLIIDDDTDSRFGLNRVLNRCGHAVKEAESGECGLAKLAEMPIDLVFCDLRFPTGLSGEQTLKAITSAHPDVKVVMMSCSMDYTAQQELKVMGASAAMQKPFFKDQCLRTLESLFPPNQQAA